MEISRGLAGPADDVWIYNRKFDLVFLTLSGALVFLPYLSYGLLQRLGASTATASLIIGLLIGAIPAAILYNSFHMGAGALTVKQDMLIRVVSPLMTLKIHGDWRSVQKHFSAAARAGTEVAAEAMRMTPEIAIAVQSGFSKEPRGYLGVSFDGPNTEELRRNGERVIRFLADLERGGGRGWRDDGVHFLEGIQEIVAD